MKKYIPVWEISRAAYRHSFIETRYAVRVIALLFPASLLLSYYLVSAEIIVARDSGALMLLLLTIVTCSIAVSWHRHQYFKSNSPPISLLRYLARSALYLWQLTSIIAITGIAAKAFFFALAAGSFFLAKLSNHSIFSGNEDTLPIEFIIIGVGLFGAVVASRLGIMLPATALGIHDFGIMSAWRATSRNGLRLMMALVLSVIPFLLSAVLVLPLTELAILREDTLFQAIIGAIACVFAFLSLMNGLTVLSLAYGFLTEDRPILQQKSIEQTQVVVRS